MRVGVLPLGRSTFDVPFAEERLAAMLARLEATGHELAGPGTLLFDAEAARTAIATLGEAAVDHVLILQVTFTDAATTVEIAEALPAPLSIWAIPEPRLGGRLRLNAFCGLNLASHALGLRGRAFGWLYADPDGSVAEALDALLAGERVPERLDPHPAAVAAGERATAVAQGLAGRRIGRIGERPAGFDTCAYDDETLDRLAGVGVRAIDLGDLFAAANEAEPSAEDEARGIAEAELAGLADVDQDQLRRSYRLKAALSALKAEGGYDAFAIRCWPETFTDYGGAVCGPVGMMGERRTPCACEADVYGALTQMVLQDVAGAPAFLTDLVDLDVDDNTGVVWHCGQAPVSMRDPDVAAVATIHTNRRMPLLYEFPLKPGRVTFLRISQAHGSPRMVLAGGEMMKRPMAFTGTSGVVRFDRPAGAVLDDIVACGLEHHMALAYGEHRPLLREVAAALTIPIVEL